MKPKTKEVTVKDEEKKEYQVTIKRLGWAERQEYNEQISETKAIPVSGVNEAIVKTVIHPFRRRVYGMKLCVIAAPFLSNPDWIDELDNTLGENLWKEIEDFNEFTKKALMKKKEPLSKPSDRQPKTQSLPKPSTTTD